MVYFRFSTTSSVCIDIKYFLSQSGKIIKFWEKKVCLALPLVYFGFETKFHIRYPIVKGIKIFKYSNGISLRYVTMSFELITLIEHSIFGEMNRSQADTNFVWQTTYICTYNVANRVWNSTWGKYGRIFWWS